jgi:hypothetical protein
MGMRGSHYALEPKQLQELLAAKSDIAKFEYLLELEQRSPQSALTTDKAWEALFRCFCAAFSLPECFEKARTEPLAKVYFGGDPISGELDYGPIFLLNENDVVQISSALRDVDRKWIEVRFKEYAQDAYSMGNGEDDVAYVWHWFSELRLFFERAAKKQQPIAFILA